MYKLWINRTRPTRPTLAKASTDGPMNGGRTEQLSVAVFGGPSRMRYPFGRSKRTGRSKRNNMKK